MEGTSTICNTPGSNPTAAAPASVDVEHLSVANGWRLSSPRSLDACRCRCCICCVSSITSSDSGVFEQPFRRHSRMCVGWQDCGCASGGFGRTPVEALPKARGVNPSLVHSRQFLACVTALSHELIQPPMSLHHRRESLNISFAVQVKRAVAQVGIG